MTLPVHGASIHIDQFPLSNEMNIGLDPAGTGDGQVSGVAQAIGTEDTTPPGVIFEKAGQEDPLVFDDLVLALPTLKPLESQAIWIKRIAEQGSTSVTCGVTVAGNEEALPVGPGSEDFHANDGVNFTGERTSLLGEARPFKIGVAKVGFSEVEA